MNGDGRNVVTSERHGRGTIGALAGASLLVLGCGGASAPSARRVSAGATTVVASTARPVPIAARPEEGLSRVAGGCPWDEDGRETSSTGGTARADSPPAGCPPWRVACDPGEPCPLEGSTAWFAARWRASVDIDLYVRTPGGLLLGPIGGWEASGGRLLREGLGGCSAEDRLAVRREVVGWPSGRIPPPGAYQVQLHYRATCASGTGPVEVWVAAGSVGQGRGPWRVTLGPGERRRVLAVRIGRPAPRPAE